MKILIGTLLVFHGLIVAGQSAGSFGSAIPGEIQNPAFMAWWPIGMGRSWLLSGLGLERHLVVYRIGGLLWLVGGVALVAAGLGMLGFLIPMEWWRGSAVIGAAISLFMLVIYFHPFMILGTASSLAVLIALHWMQWPTMIMIR